MKGNKYTHKEPPNPTTHTRTHLHTCVRAQQCRSLSLSLSLLTCAHGEAEEWERSWLGVKVAAAAPECRVLYSSMRHTHQLSCVEASGQCGLACLTHTVWHTHRQPSDAHSLAHTQATTTTITITYALVAEVVACARESISSCFPPFFFFPPPPSFPSTMGAPTASARLSLFFKNSSRMSYLFLLVVLLRGL